MSADQAAEPTPCGHLWVSTHESGHRFQWIRRCLICHGVDWDDLDAQADEYAAAMVEAHARPPRNKRSEEGRVS